MLIFAAPALVVVTITAIPEGDTGVVDINYVSDANVSSFGLDITVTDGNIIDVNGYHVGECDGTTKGFGIFPASFFRVIDPCSPNWSDPDYTPVADPCDNGAKPGIDTNSITIEMGALYTDGNQPPLSGRLCKVHVTKTCYLTVTVNPIRCGKTGGGQEAGVVMEDGTAVVPDLAGATGILVEVQACDCWGDVTGDDKNSAGDMSALLMHLFYNGGTVANGWEADFCHPGPP